MPTYCDRFLDGVRGFVVVVVVARAVRPGVAGRRWSGCAGLPGELGCPLSECRHGGCGCWRNRNRAVEGGGGYAVVMTMDGSEFEVAVEVADRRPHSRRSVLLLARCNVRIPTVRRSESGSRRVARRVERLGCVASQRQLLGRVAGERLRIGVNWRLRELRDAAAAWPFPRDLKLWAALTACAARRGRALAGQSTAAP